MNSIFIAATVGMIAATTPADVESAALAGRSDVGANVFKKCMACHQLGPDARNSVGPVLNGVVGRPAGTFPGYPYSSATKNSGLVWDEGTLTRYLRAPRAVVPNTKMAFVGLSKDQDIADVITFLRGFDANGNKAPQ
jgi:cytochrome c